MVIRGRWVGLVLCLILAGGSAFLGYVLAGFSRHGGHGVWMAFVPWIAGNCCRGLMVLLMSRRGTARARARRETVGPIIVAVMSVGLMAALAPTGDDRGFALALGAFGTLSVGIFWVVDGKRTVLLERVRGEAGVSVTPWKRLDACKWLRGWPDGMHNGQVWAGYVAALRDTGHYQGALREFEREFHKYRGTPTFGQALDAAVDSAKCARGASGGDDLLIRVVTECPGTFGAGLATQALMERAQIQQTTHET